MIRSDQIVASLFHYSPGEGVEEEIRRIAPHHYLVRAEMDLGEFSRFAGVGMRPGLATTVGGHVSERLGKIPPVGYVYHEGGWAFTVKQADPRHIIELEVRRQLDAMLALDDASDPNFGDADYQLAAYAAALRVLTAQPIEDIDPAREIGRVRAPGEESAVERLIQSAVKIACDHLVPRGLDSFLWKRLEPAERFYLKGLEVESHGEYRNGVYQELARGFGAVGYTELLADTTANQTRLKTPKEFACWGKALRQAQGEALAARCCGRSSSPSGRLKAAKSRAVG